MTADRLSEIEARLNAAMPGKWRAVYDSRGLMLDNWWVLGPDDVFITGSNEEFNDALSQSDADLIAHAPDDLRYLLERVRELEAALERTANLYHK